MRQCCLSAAGRAELLLSAKACSCAVENASADAQGVSCVLRAVTSTGDVLSVLTLCAIGRLYSGCSHLRCVRWDESGPHFIFGFVVMVEIDASCG